MVTVTWTICPCCTEITGLTKAEEKGNSWGVRCTQESAGGQPPMDVATLITAAELTAVKLPRNVIAAPVLSGLAVSVGNVLLDAASPDPLCTSVHAIVAWPPPSIV